MRCGFDVIPPVSQEHPVRLLKSRIISVLCLRGVSEALDGWL